MNHLPMMAPPPDETLATAPGLTKLRWLARTVLSRETCHLAEEVPGIDVMVVGHVPGSGYDGERVGDTWMLRTGQRGQMVSFLNMTVADGVIASAKGIFEELGPTMPHDADLQTRTALFDTNIKSLREKVGPKAPTR